MSSILEMLIDESLERNDIHDSFSVTHRASGEAINFMDLGGNGFILRFNIKIGVIKSHNGIVEYILGKTSRLFGMSDPIWNDEENVVTVY